MTRHLYFHIYKCSPETQTLAGTQSAIQFVLEFLSELGVILTETGTAGLGKNFNFSVFNITVWGGGRLAPLAEPCSIFFKVTTKWIHYQIHRCCSASPRSIVYCIFANSEHL